MSTSIFESYLAEYRERLARRRPPDRPFLFTMKRVLAWARR